MELQQEDNSFHLGVNTLFHVPGDVGGTEIYLREQLLAIVKNNPELPVTLFTNSDNDFLMRSLFKQFSSVFYELLPFRASIRPLRIIAEQVWLPQRVLRSRVDILWSPGYTAPGFVGCPQVITVHDLQYKSHPEDVTWLERIVLDTLVKMACKKSKAIIAVSEFSKNEIIKYRFAPASKIHAILEGVDGSFGIPVKDEAVHRKMGNFIPLDEPFILCVAHSYPHKNVDMLIDAFRETCQSIPHNLVIIGKPRLGEPDVDAAVNRLGKTKRFYRIKDGASFDLLKLFYQKADLFVLPSSYEGFGLPVLEAMMAETPVVCFNKASIPEVGGDFVNYVQEYSSLKLGQEILNVLARSIEERDEACKKARQWAEEFTWEKAAFKTVALLSSSRRR